MTVGARYIDIQNGSFNIVSRSGTHFLVPDTSFKLVGSKLDVQIGQIQSTVGTDSDSFSFVLHSTSGKLRVFDNQDHSEFAVSSHTLNRKQFRSI